MLVQHSETSTGVLHDVRGYAAVTRGTDAILVVDAVSSLGIADLPMDAWGVDVVVAGSQKGLMLPPGLGFCALSDKAWAKNKTAKLPRYYLDLAEERKTLAKNEAHFTPAVSIVVGLRDGHPDARARRAGQRLQAPRSAGAGHARRRGSARPRVSSARPRRARRSPRSWRRPA